MLGRKLPVEGQARLDCVAVVDVQVLRVQAGLQRELVREAVDALREGLQQAHAAFKIAYPYPVRLAVFVEAGAPVPGIRLFRHFIQFNRITVERFSCRARYGMPAPKSADSFLL